MKHPIIPFAAVALIPLLVSAGDTKEPIGNYGLELFSTVWNQIDGVKTSIFKSFGTAIFDCDQFRIDVTYHGEEFGPRIFSAQCLLAWHQALPVQRDQVEPFFRTTAIPFVGDENFDAFYAWWPKAFGRHGETATFGENRFTFEANPDRPGVFWLRIDRP